MIVMILVTQNNFLNGPGTSDRILAFYPDTDFVHWIFGVYFRVIVREGAGVRTPDVTVLVGISLSLSVLMLLLLF